MSQRTQLLLAVQLICGALLLTTLLIISNESSHASSHPITCAADVSVQISRVGLLIRPRQDILIMWPRCGFGMAAVSYTDHYMDRQCRCDVEGMPHNFCYHLPLDPQIKGRRFNCTYSSSLQKLGLLSMGNALDLRTDEMPHPIFVTAMSNNHFKEGLTLVNRFDLGPEKIANVRKLWSNRKILVYNLGLSYRNSNELKAKCLVELRDFPFEEYPHYVKNLKEYRWKPLLIAMTVKEFGAVWYMDTSVRWKKDRLQMVHDEIRCRKNYDWSEWQYFYIHPNVSAKCGKSAYLLQLSSTHAVYPTTNPGVYEYFPTLLRYMKQKSSGTLASLALVVRTRDAMEIMKWSVLCALEKDCMAPPGAKLKCTFGDDRYFQYAECHRYDQSVINLLLANTYGYSSKNYLSVLGAEGATLNRSASENLRAEDFLCGN